MSWTKIDNQALRSDAKKVLSRTLEIMKHPAITEYSWTQTDMDNITSALETLKRMEHPRNMVDRLLNDAGMANVENGLYWSAAMLDRNGFQEAKGAAWNVADQEFAKATRAELVRLTVHQRN